ncbi:hypothetical protein GE061_008882 [Apolygus lucorum]|uniref:Dipeptidase n=1 Tax=Apolygus lucorum TaxID=248454 RepID=A0A8S9XZ12_APOLU|nr:hypothetical protein GE061_008882 [Apolygus lucorum]
MIGLGELYQVLLSSTNVRNSSITSSPGCLCGASCIPGFRLKVKQRWFVLAALILAAAAGVGLPIALKIQAGASLEERLEIASRLLQEVPLIDGHNDLPWNIRKFVHNRLSELRFSDNLKQIPPWSLSAWSHTDLLRLKAGQVSAQRTLYTHKKELHGGHYMAHRRCKTRPENNVELLRSLPFLKPDAYRRFS